PVDLHDAAPGVAADAERDVEPERARGDRRDLLVEALPLLEPHDRALAELFLDADEGEGEGSGVLLLVVLLVAHGGEISGWLNRWGAAAHTVRPVGRQAARFEG